MDLYKLGKQCWGWLWYLHNLRSWILVAGDKNLGDWSPGLEHEKTWFASFFNQENLKNHNDFKCLNITQNVSIERWFFLAISQNFYWVSWSSIIPRREHSLWLSGTHAITFLAPLPPEPRILHAIWLRRTPSGLHLPNFNHEHQIIIQFSGNKDIMTIIWFFPWILEQWLPRGKDLIKFLIIRIWIHSKLFEACFNRYTKSVPKIELEYFPNEITFVFS